MKCPSCNQSASSFFRNVFTLQGVSLIKSMQGYFKCQQCGTLLRIVSYGRQFWYFAIPTTIVLVLYAVLYRRLFSVIGTDATVVIWIILILAIMMNYSFGLWKFAQVKKVDTENQTTTTQSA
jgi:hypothetical protein